ncbi:phosphoglycerate dehydrogenase [Nocardioides lentus]|uniref:Phosphoglycerate dehydrogenase n=1 Tax=Nocardioides lentus TaxID=338077 RepID=A0ABN2PTH2_9ACTN
MSARWSVLSTSPSFGVRDREAVALLKDSGCDVEVAPGLRGDALVAALTTTDAWIFGFEPVGADLLRHATRLRVVAKNGAGTDNVDHVWLAARGIAVVNAPDGNAHAVAEYAVGQLIHLSRGLGDNDRAVRAGRWAPVVGPGLDGRTLGVLGLGRVGRRLTALATALGMRVLAHDPAVDDDQVGAAGAEPVPLDDLFAAADAVSVHVPLTDATRGLVDARRLALLGPEGVLVDCSRGGVVDEPALVAALHRGDLAGAALDVFAEEPLPSGSPLLEAPRVLLSPHGAGYSESSVRAVGRQCAHRVIDALARPRTTPHPRSAS